MWHRVKGDAWANDGATTLTTTPPRDRGQRHWPRTIWHLDAVSGQDVSQIGGKAGPLARLAREGLPVPRGLVVPCSVFDRVLALEGPAGVAEQVHREGEGDGARKLRTWLASLEPDPAWAAALVRAVERLSGPVAVRSSAVDEDGERQSFAGQHESYLGLDAAEVPAAVVRCWASLYAERALAYRRGAGPAPGSMAVLIQRMVDAEVSGVLFTMNPVSGSWREVVVEAVWGLAEGLVSGGVAPHGYVLQRPRRTPRPVQRVLARLRLPLIDEQLPPIHRQWALSRSGQVVVGPVPSDRVHARTLTESQVRRLARLGLRIEARFGGAQDIEWARGADGRLWVLQARPISTETAAPAPEVLWTRRFIGERFPDPVHPASWSIIEPILAHFISYPKVQDELLGGGDPLRLVHGRPYVNVTVFRHLMFKLPGGAPLRFMLDLLPADEADRIRRKFVVPPDLRVYRALLSTTVQERRWRRFAWNPFSNPRAWAVFEAEMAGELPGLSVEPVTPADRVAQVERLMGLLQRYVGIHVCSLLFADLWDQVFEGLLHLAVPDRAVELRELLVVTPSGNRTLEVNAALWEVRRLVDEADLEALEAGVLPSGASGAALSRFLERYGHRADVSWDLFAPRWAEDLPRLAQMLRAMEGEDPRVRAAERSRRYAESRCELDAAISDPTLKQVVPRLLDLLRSYLLLRENQRFAFEQLQWALRASLIRVGRDVVEGGALEDPQWVAFCSWAELRRAALTPEASPNLTPVARRRAERLREQGAIVPPVFLRGDQPVAPAQPFSDRLRGQGVSAGRASGPVRRARSLDEARSLQPGEILVAPSVDPAWTPLFLVAAGVVLEMGSRLSHGAVVAREYRVPAVVNVEDAFARLTDGQWVTVDGSRGAVFVHPPELTQEVGDPSVQVVPPREQVSVRLGRSVADEGA
jgi:phosphohistidine swiveling domain-containing protein